MTQIPSYKTHWNQALELKVKEHGRSTTYNCHRTKLKLQMKQTFL